MTTYCFKCEKLETIKGLSLPVKEGGVQPIPPAVPRIAFMWCGHQKLIVRPM